MLGTLCCLTQIAFGSAGAASNVLWARWGWPAGMDDFQQRVGIVALPPESVNDVSPTEHHSDER